jgi:hypothetical protein
MRRTAARWLHAAVSAGIVGALLVLALAPASPALAAPAVTLDPTTVPTSGQFITVRVSGCPPGEPITVASSAQTRPLGPLNADGSGSATTSVTSAPTAGVFTVTATCGGATASSTFTVVAPPAGPSGEIATPNVKLLGIGGGVLAGAVLLTVALIRRRSSARSLT